MPEGYNAVAEHVLKAFIGLDINMESSAVEALIEGNFPFPYTNAISAHGLSGTRLTYGKRRKEGLIIDANSTASTSAIFGLY
jgi:hypothetical protein